jgi:hypothetical protein
MDNLPPKRAFSRRHSSTNSTPDPASEDGFGTTNYWLRTLSRENAQRSQQDDQISENLPSSHSITSTERNYGDSGSYISSYFPTTPLSPYTSIPQRKPLSSISQTTIDSTGTRQYSISKYVESSEVETLIERRADRVAIWGVHWVSIVAMVGLFILGVIGAVSHHAYYTTFDGHEATDQLMKFRYGAAFAFFTKMTLVGSVVVAYRQRIWHTFRRKSLTLVTIDGLFAAIEDPTSFWNWEMLKNAKLATLMAMATW